MLNESNKYKLNVHVKSTVETYMCTTVSLFSRIFNFPENGKFFKNFSVILENSRNPENLRDFRIREISRKVFHDFQHFRSYFYHFGMMY